ncbi:sulfatase family protein [Arenibacter palladensis]|uniref:sulfatase family protein n=1 Tax=Arenibacter palladensis TaxID=237373 RepID=UPI0026E312AA|nr:sulfatase [Arenibacter palladensis]MDO6602853.1 sulfatase [Arenibacter palladensis]
MIKLKKAVIILTAFGISNSAFGQVAKRSPENKPNFIVIFIDDMGYGDIGPFGSKNKTPQLDLMAAEGRRFTDFYVSSTNCTPSRAALLTGSYADRIGMDGDVVFPGDHRGLNPTEITIAEILKGRGYTTGCFGKWHLGDQPGFLPLKQGFDEYEGIPYSNDMWVHNTNRKKEGWPPLPYIRQEKVVAHIPDAKSQALLCEATTDATIDFIKRNQDNPFFAYIPYSFVHHPQIVEQSRADNADGDITRAQIEELDQRIGQIIFTLKELEIDKNTLVLFTSDNGGAKGTSMGGLRGKKGHQKYEGSMRAPTLAWWPGKIKPGSVISEYFSTIDILPTIAAISGAKIPNDREIDGKDVSKLLFKSRKKTPHKVLFYEYEGVRVDDWKLVIPNIGAAAELYNLKNDIGEQNNVAGKYPAKVQKLEDLLQKHKKYVKSGQRTAAFVKNPEPLIKDTKGLPSLAEYLNRNEIETAGFRMENKN